MALSALGSYLPDFAAVLAQGDEAFDGYVTSLFAYAPFVEWGFKYMAWHHGVTTPSAFMRELDG